MAIARRPTDLWGHVRRGLIEQGPATSNTIPLPVTHTLHLPDLTERRWHDPRTEARAAAHLSSLERALARGRHHAAARRRSRWLHTLHLDRLQHARSVAGQLGLCCDPMGHGPLVDRPIVLYRDRLPWVVAPVSPYRDPQLPVRAAAIVEEWNTLGDVFDRFYRADEPPTSQLATHSLIGVVCTNGSGDWFVLDRWAS